jgi:hypothetical protein
VLHLLRTKVRSSVLFVRRTREEQACYDVLL